MMKPELAHMHNSGMILGSHTVNHLVMSKLTVSEQEQEIVSSFEMIESITGKQTLKTFCYPYGGFHTFTPETEKLLESNSCLFSFNVEPRSIDQRDLMTRKQSLPRFDCNAFPYGAYRHS
jgi:peptidoglycan/xylan/chitin deacetylase (PgdA/CDA1 family)